MSELTKTKAKKLTSQEKIFGTLFGVVLIPLFTGFFAITLTSANQFLIDFELLPNQSYFNLVVVEIICSFLYGCYFYVKLVKFQFGSQELGGVFYGLFLAFLLLSMANCLYIPFASENIWLKFFIVFMGVVFLMTRFEDKLQIFRIAFGFITFIYFGILVFVGYLIVKIISVYVA